MIILDGCDATGKTTLANKLCEALGFPRFKNGVVHREGAEYYLRHALSNPYHTVADRFHLTEYAYPSLKQDGRVPLLVELQHLLERVMMIQPSVLIYCQTDEATIAENFRVRGEDNVRPEEIKQLLYYFQVAYDQSILPKMIYDYRTTPPEVVLRFIMNRINERKELGDDLAQFEGVGEYLGNPIMLVGESYTDGQWVGPRINRALSKLTGSSVYLSRALRFNSDKTYYLTNAKKYEEPYWCERALQEEVRLVQPSKVIALGEVAHQHLFAARIAHQQVEHPQYRKRFKYDQIEEYSKQLR